MILFYVYKISLNVLRHKKNRPNVRGMCSDHVKLMKISLFITGEKEWQIYEGGETQYQFTRLNSVAIF